DNPQLLAVLKRNNVSIDNRITALNMLVIDLPVHVAEQVASVQSAKHLSLDKEIKLLGHVETTTGASLVRNQTRTTYVGGQQVNTPYQLDGTDVGIAVVDSGVYENHRSFLDAFGVDRVIRTQNFAGTTSDSSRDP